MRKRLFASVVYAALLFAFAAAARPALAQSETDPQDSALNAERRSPEQVVERLAEKLNLSDEQKTKIAPIITERQQKLQELRADTSMRRIRKARKMKSVVDDSEKRIERILDKEQRQKYTELKQEIRKQAEGVRKSRRS